MRFTVESLDDAVENYVAPDIHIFGLPQSEGLDIRISVHNTLPL